MLRTASAAFIAGAPNKLWQHIGMCQCMPDSRLACLRSYCVISCTEHHVTLGNSFILEFFYSAILHILYSLLCLDV
jgi:hypothetical protein